MQTTGATDAEPTEQKADSLKTTAPALAFDYATEGYSTDGSGLLKGRQAAGEGFLRGYARHSSAERFFCLCEKRSVAQSFLDLICQERPGRVELVHVPRRNPEKLRQAGAVFHPDPVLAPLARQRRWFGEAAWSLVGVTHTICSHGVLDAIGSLPFLPLHPWDALICTSRAVRDAVDQQLAAVTEDLAERSGARVECRAQLPIIPLGVNCDALAPEAENQRGGRELRHRLGIAEDAVAVLFMGRLSYHAKAHPLPLFLACEEIAERSSVDLHLIFAGEFPNIHIDREFREAGRRWAPSVSQHFLDGRSAEIRRFVWHAAEIFASPSDNFQETFGLTPIEAMAAGLPVVAADWNGYRDTVRHGVDGFLIATSTPPPGVGLEFARRHSFGEDTYDRYLAKTSQMVALDIPALTEALGRLVHSRELRARMGAAARHRALMSFDWSRVVVQYEDLLRELASERTRAPELWRAPSADPLRDDPLRVFKTYPSRMIDTSTRFERIGDLERLQDLLRESTLQNGPLADPQALYDLWQNPDSGPRDALTLQRLSWLLKVGMLRVVERSAGVSPALRPYVFLDRDGTLIEDRGYPFELEDYRPLDRSHAAVRRLRAAGFGIVVVSNQSGVGRGFFSPEQLEAFNARLQEDFAAKEASIDAVYCCPHSPDDGCSCRKPSPGLIEAARRDLKIDFTRSWVVGDRSSDVALAAPFAMRAVLVRTGDGEEHTDRVPAHIPVADDLNAAADIICEVDEDPWPAS